MIKMIEINEWDINDRPKGYYCENLRMLNINVTDISRNDWFK